MLLHRGDVHHGHLARLQSGEQARDLEFTRGSARDEPQWLARRNLQPQRRCGG
jgi:hypothetical protein